MIAEAWWTGAWTVAASLVGVIGALVAIRANRRLAEETDERRRAADREAFLRDRRDRLYVDVLASARAVLVGSAGLFQRTAMGDTRELRSFAWDRTPEMIEFEHARAGADLVMSEPVRSALAAIWQEVLVRQFATMAALHEDGQELLRDRVDQVWKQNPPLEARLLEVMRADL